MMKVLTKAICILLAAVLIVSLAACSGGNSIAGTWKYHLDFKTVVEQQVPSTSSESEKAMYDKMVSALEGVNIDFFFEFGSDNTFKFYADEESANQAIEQIKKSMTSILPDLFEAMGISKDAFDSYLKSSGSTLEELAESYTQNMDTDSIKDLSVTGVYKTDGNKLYIAEKNEEIDDNSYFIYEIEKDMLSFTDINSNVESLNKLKEWGLPMQLEKVK